MTRRVGGLAWILAVVGYLAAQVIAAAAWNPAYNWSRNYISDLGNTACGQFAAPHGTPSYVCSPKHELMNQTFIVIGILALLGALLLTSYWPRSKRRTVGIVLLVLVGIAKTIVGIAPENENINLHTLGALNLPLMGVAVLLLALVSPRGGMRSFGVLIGLVVIVASGLLIAGQVKGPALYLGLGVGGMERLASYPSNLWMLAIGLIALFGGRAAPPVEHTRSAAYPSEYSRNGY
jgi:hypothetical membrane protein